MTGSNRRRGADLDIGKVRRKTRARLIEGADVGNGRILVVDDDAVVIELISETLGLVGYATEGANTYREAVAAARQHPPALAIIDIALPDRSGWEVFETLRNEIGPELPVIFISGERTAPYDRVAGLLAGGDDFLAKPFDPGELIARVRARLRRVPVG